MRLHELKLTNFGPHRHLSLPLAPLTVITGGNGTGKSSIAEALRLALTGDWLLRGLSRKRRLPEPPASVEVVDAVAPANRLQIGDHLAAGLFQQFGERQGKRRRCFSAVRLTDVLAVFEKSVLAGRQWTENE